MYQIGKNKFNLNIKTNITKVRENNVKDWTLNHLKKD